MTMESLGDILRRIGTAATARTTNGTGDVPAPEPRRANDCPICKGSGWVTYRVPVGHPDFGQAKPCQCRQNEASLSSRMEALRRYSNLGALSRLTFAATRPEGPLSDMAARQMFAEGFAQAAAYAENPEGWLALTGPSGSGKTHLAAAVANRCIERQNTTFFIMVADLLDHLRSAYSPSSEIAYDELFEQVRNVPVLVLDDLGAHSSTPWAQEKLHQVIYHRFNNSLATIVTIRGQLTRLEESLRTRLEFCGFSKVLQLGQFRGHFARDLGSIKADRLSLMTFDSFDPAGNPKATRQQREEIESALDAARRFVSFPEESWLFLNGNRGCGKTHLAIAIANESLKQGRQVFFAFVPDLLQHLRATYSPESRVGFDELFEYVLNAPLLILDDLGAESSTPWAEEKLFQLIGYRHENRMATVITSAAKMGELEEKRPAIFSRLVDDSVVEWVAIEAPNYKDRRPR